MPHDFIAKFAAGGGPPPLQLLGWIVGQADSSLGRDAWFATRKRGRRWNGPGICILLTRELRAVIAEVIGRGDNMPGDAGVRELYQGHEGFNAWWHVRNPIHHKFRSLDEIPGHGCTGLQGAAHAFGGQAAFVYWDFGDMGFDDLAGTAAGVIRTVPNLVRPAAAVQPVNTLPAAESDCELWPRPEVPLHGVDFSGGEEDQRYGNRKIWVAKWSPGKDVALQCGWSNDGAGKICRSDLPGLIRREPGWWSLDFPFGIAKETARALRLNTWPEWLRWCAGAGDATTRRNEARELTNQAGVAWSVRRQVDEIHQTTWFPLFEQLYRQTIYGAREVLLPLHNEGSCILPWGLTALEESVIIVEGFPGAVVRKLLGRGVSYKGSTGAHKTARQGIVQVLKSRPLAIPIPDDAAVKAVDDQDGDAVDALVLLVGSWIAQRLPAEEWKQQLAMLDGCDAGVEGWFPI